VAEYTNRQKLGLFTGLPLFLVLLLLPQPAGLSAEGQRTLAITILMAFWWITEAVPLPVTALLPLVLFPLLKIDTAGAIAGQYGDKNIFLFMGGFFLATAIEKWNLHKRIALRTVYILGTSPEKVILGMMIATAAISMWISNTATTMMMLPIALAIARYFQHQEKIPPESAKINSQFGTALLFGIGYSASIGGIGTLIGTPPNIIFASQVQQLYPNAPEISFFKWMLVGLPLVIVFIPLTWLYLVKVAHPVQHNSLAGSRSLIKEELQALGPLARGEKFVLAVFLLTVFGWMLRRNIELGFVTLPGWSNLLGIEHTVHDSTVAILAAILLFALPVNLKKGEFLLDWKTALKIPWGILLLFGGGLALAHEFKISGLAAWIGTNLNILQVLPVLLVVIIIVLLIDFLTEVTSNTAITSIFLPILGATALAMKVHPFLFMIGGTIAASLAFMLPVATPPNAVIFGSGFLTVPQMVKTGFFLNIVGMIITIIVLYLIAIPVFGISLDVMPDWVH